MIGQFERLRLGEPDPAPIPSSWVAVVKIALLVLSIAALAATLRARPEHIEAGPSVPPV